MSSKRKPITLAQARKQTERRPEDPSAWLLLGKLLTQQGWLEEARGTLQRALELKPECHEALEWLAQGALRQHRPMQAFEYLEQAQALEPDSVTGLVILAKVYLELAGANKAVEIAARANQLEPDKSQILDVLGSALGSAFRYDEAIEVFDRLISRDPNNFVHWNNAGNMRRELGRLEEAYRCYRKASALNPDNPIAYSNHLTAMHYDPSATREAIAELARSWEERYGPAEVLSRPVPGHREPGKRLRIGLLSDGFRKHPVGKMIVRCLENLKPAEAEVYAYTSNEVNDELTQRIKATARHWQPMRYLSDEDFAEQLRDHKIDILIDLSGHNAGSRMRVMAMQPAPLLVKWVGGLINTTGVRAIDYLISDAIETPEGEDGYYTEKLIRMPDDYIVFDPPAKLPEVGELPAKRNGYITLACFNNPTKLNKVTLAEWARLMHKLPDSRLLLKGRPYTSESFCERLYATMEDEGIPRDRLIIEGPGSNHEMLEAYNQADIALDPWPYSGGLSTCEAFIMGVPVVTLPGPTFAGRHSATHLVHAGMPELVTHSWEEYHERVQGLASDLDSLSTIRQHLREVLLQSPVCDGQRFARHFTAAMRAIWQRYCEDKAPAALTFNKAGEAWFDGESEAVQLVEPEPLPEEEKGFQWKFEGKIIAIDNGGQLLRHDAIQQMLQHRTMELIAFDPASQALNNPLNNQEGVHYYPNVILGDGEPGTLYACLDPSLSATLKPLEGDHLPEAVTKGNRVLTQMPISSIALDKIDGLPSIDWLVLDAMSDSSSILEHGQQALKDTLLIQAKVAFQPTHDHQPNLAELSHWASRHGFRFYRMNDPVHHSYFLGHDDLQKHQASELVSADALFLPSHQRTELLSDNQRVKLAFLLHTVYGVKDLTYTLLGRLNVKDAENYLSVVVDQPRQSESQLSSGKKTAKSSLVSEKNDDLQESISAPSRELGIDAQSISLNPEDKDDNGYHWQLNEKIHVVDVGANPIDGSPPYSQLLAKGALRLVGFEPQREALKKLNNLKGGDETYLPHAVGDGGAATLYLCKAPGMTSTLKPNKKVLNHFQGYPIWGEVESREKISTIRLDDVDEISKIDWLKIDIQGGELSVFKSAEEKLSDALVIQTEVNFIHLYEGQPLFAEIDLWMREHGFMLHALLEQRKRLYAPMVVGNQIHQGINQLTTADAVYVRDINTLDELTDDQKKKMALILHSAYGSYDLVLRILKECNSIDENDYVRNINNNFSINVGSCGGKMSTAKDRSTSVKQHIFVVGCGHTGTTLMASILGSHSIIYTVARETNWFLSKREIFNEEYREELANARYEGKNILCEKTPRHLYEIDAIKNIFPDSKFIIMTRDVKDVVCSIKNRSGDFGSALSRWVKDNKKAISYLGRRDVMLVRYEDLVEDPEASIKQVCDFIEVGFEPKMVEFHKVKKNWFGMSEPKETDGKGEKSHIERRAWQMTQPIHDRRGVWRGKLSKEEVSVIEREAEDVMHRLYT